MPEIPHFYVVKGHLPIEDQAVFDLFEKIINKDGYKQQFNSKEYKYLNIDGYKYWFCEDVLNREVVK